MVPRGTVLIVDTDRALVEFIVAALTEEGYTAFNVHDGAATTAPILTQGPDLLLIDLLFGRIHGGDLIRAVRVLGIDTPIVLMTTQTLKAEALEAQGAVAYLRKPFSLDELLACVTTHLRPSQAPPQSAA
jgi:DNA-binding response OmpR family regulator